MEPKRFYQSRRKGFHRRRTATSGTNEFQICRDRKLRPSAATRVPDTRCGELRGGISSHPPGMARNLRPVEAAAESASLHRMKTARSTEFPLRRLAVRGCERTMSEAKRRAPMRSIGDRISGAAECQGDCGAIEPTKPPTGMKWRLSIFEVVRWFLLPEVEPADGGMAADCKSAETRRQALTSAPCRH